MRHHGSCIEQAIGRPTLACREMLSDMLSALPVLQRTPSPPMRRAYQGPASFTDDHAKYVKDHGASIESAVTSLTLRATRELHPFPLFRLGQLLMQLAERDGSVPHGHLAEVVALRSQLADLQARLAAAEAAAAGLKQQMATAAEAQAAADVAVTWPLQDEVLLVEAHRLQPSRRRSRARRHVEHARAATPQVQVEPPSFRHDLAQRSGTRVDGRLFDARTAYSHASVGGNTTDPYASYDSSLDSTGTASISSTLGGGSGGESDPRPVQARWLLDQAVSAV